MREEEKKKKKADSLPLLLQISVGAEEQTSLRLVVVAEKAHARELRVLLER